ncbi:hypothetical protein QQZ08_000490 [Neonectria magnoliae]|uniref:Heterokaryon incompatibility domain-containing protein n=1 Tax=Neonectria magnoliae TaxID=2732573 RepID=A0ABR1IH86_9HYPO
MGERAAQVSLMGSIYSRDSYVLAFLSPLSTPFDIGLWFLEVTAEDSKLHYELSLTPHITVDGLTATSEALRESLIAFFVGPWWIRVWTVREYALAEQVIFQCGSRMINAKVMAQAFLSLVHHESKCCWAAHRAADGNARGVFDYPSKVHGGLSLFAATLQMSNLNYLTDTETFGILDVLGAISLFRTRHCTDLQDRVSGISGLHVKGGEKPQRVVPTDYTASTALVYLNLAMAVIEASQTSMKAEWKLNGSESAKTRGFQITKIAATAPGYPRRNSTTSGRLLLNTWHNLAGLPVDPNVQSPNGETDEAKREWAFQRSLCGNLNLQQWAGDS